MSSPIMESKSAADRKPRRWSLQDVPNDIRDDHAKVGAWVKAHVAKLADEDAAIGNSYDYTGIPLNSDGTPTIFLLPSGTRAYYEERLASFEKAWNATKDPAYYRQANKWTRIFRQPQPDWLAEAGDMLAAELRAKSPSFDERYEDNQKHFVRFMWVRDHLDPALAALGVKFHTSMPGEGLPAGVSKTKYRNLEKQALDKAFAALNPTEDAEGNAWSTIKSSFGRVGRNIKNHLFGHYTPISHGFRMPPAKDPAE
jgi:hypothetical protein